MLEREKIYNELCNELSTMFAKNPNYNQYLQRINFGRTKTFRVSRMQLDCTFECDWLEFLEDCIIALDNIVRNPRKFIVQEEDIVDISLARSISTESIKHLAQHTNLINSVDKKTGMVLPDKILNVWKEESLEIYENRFIYTLLNNLKMFIDKRLTNIAKAVNTGEVLTLDVESEYTAKHHEINLNLNCEMLLPRAEKSPEGVKILNRINKLSGIIVEFLSSPFAKGMAKTTPVRPPIQRTNVILKNPNFKKALTLWQFIETYNKSEVVYNQTKKKLPISEVDMNQILNTIFMTTQIVESYSDSELELLEELSFDKNLIHEEAPKEFVPEYSEEPKEEKPEVKENELDTETVDDEVEEPKPQELSKSDQKIRDILDEVDDDEIEDDEPDELEIELEELYASKIVHLARRKVPLLGKKDIKSINLLIDSAISHFKDQQKEADKLEQLAFIERKKQLQQQLKDEREQFAKEKQAMREEVGVVRKEYQQKRQLIAKENNKKLERVSRQEDKKIRSLLKIARTAEEHARVKLELEEKAKRQEKYALDLQNLQADALRNLMAENEKKCTTWNNMFYVAKEKLLLESNSEIQKLAIKTATLNKEELIATEDSFDVLAEDGEQGAETVSTTNNKVTEENGTIV